MALVGFTKTLAIEGAKYGIKATVIAPVRHSLSLLKVPAKINQIAASPMTETIMPPEMLANLQVREQGNFWCID